MMTLVHERTREDELVFEVRMADKDQAAIIAQSQALLQKITVTGTIFFFAVCFIMSFNLFYLFTNIAKSESILAQGNAAIAQARIEEADIRAVINNQKISRAKINYLYQHLARKP